MLARALPSWKPVRQVTTFASRARFTTRRHGRRIAMPVPQSPLTGDGLLAAVTDAMVALHERYHHRAPVTAKTSMMGDDLLVCVLGGVYTEVEKTMIELQRQTIVAETRSAFQDAMQERFISEVETLSGRRVLAFMSDSNVGPDLEIELFVLAPAT
jgi:uncharacterized protein YbcI